jgi:hypothetical protein
LCWKAGVTKYAHPLRADMVGGHPREDQQDSAQLRVRYVTPFGVIPTRMLHRGPFSAVPSRKWHRFRRRGAGPASTGRRHQGLGSAVVCEWPTCSVVISARIGLG